MPLEIATDPFEIGLVEDLLVLRGAQEESAATNIVDLAGHSLGVIVDATDEAVTKDLDLAASDAEMVLDVTSGLFEVKGAEMVTDGDALVKSTCPVQPSTGPRRGRSAACEPGQADRGGRA